MGDWPGGRDLLFSTPHGSHLYGTAHEHSDRDVYVVLTNVRHERASWSRQRIDGDVDLTMIDLGTFLAQCTLGVPQALEAMYSPRATYDTIGALRAGWRVGTQVWPTYRRTMRNFIETGHAKRRVHALRLALNVRSIREHGRFDPVLTPEQVAWCRANAQRLDVLDLAEQVGFGDRPIGR